MVAERRLQLLDFLGHKPQTAVHVYDLLGELPVNAIDLRFRFQIEQPERERLLRFFLDLLDVVQALETIAAFQPLLHIENIANKLVVLFGNIDFEFRRGFFDGTKRFNHQHGMMGHDRAAAFVHDRRMRNAFGIADVHDVPDHVVGIFLERIVRGAVEIAPRAVVIDT